MKENKKRIRLELLEFDMEEVELIIKQYRELSVEDLKTLLAFSATIIGADETAEEHYRSVDEIFDGVVLRGKKAWETKEALKESLERLAAQRIAGKAHRVWDIEGGRIKRQEVYSLNYVIEFFRPRYQYEEKDYYY